MHSETDDFLVPLMMSAITTTDPLDMADVESFTRAEIKREKKKADVLVATWPDSQAQDGLDWLFFFGDEHLENIKATGKGAELRVRPVHVTSPEVAERLCELFHEPPPASIVCTIEDQEPVLYVETRGKRIAKRYSGQNWISLEPGYTVRGSEPDGDYNSLTIEYRRDEASA
jgi:hypothetical protein